MVSSCSCQHPYQDSLYGRGNRVFNMMKSPASYRCTVCSKTKTVAVTKENKVEKKG